MLQHLRFRFRDRGQLREGAESGFTLLEMLVAITILSGAMVTVFASLSWSLVLSQQARLAMEARILVQNLLVQARTDSNVFTAEKHGETETGLSWSVRMRPYGGADTQDRVRAAMVTAEVRWAQRGSSKTYSVASLVLLPKGALP